MPVAGALLDADLVMGEDPEVSQRAAPSPPPPPPPSPRRHRPRSGAPDASGSAPPEPAGARAGGRRNVGTAVLTGVGVGIVALICFAAGSAVSLVLVALVVTLAAGEAYSAFRRAGHQSATLLGLVAVLALMIAVYNRGQQAEPLIAVLVVAFSAIWYMVGVQRVPDPVPGVAVTVLVYTWIGVLGSYGALLLDPTVFPDRHGIAFLLGALIAAVAYDVGALAVGSWVGRRPLSPTISPHKTWEGLIGGSAAAIVVSAIVVQAIHPWNLGDALLLGIVVSIVSPIGDLWESVVKRHLGLKDMGRLLPGHGGVLDRIDGLLFILPATYYLVKAVHLG